MIILQKQADWKHFREKILPPGSTTAFAPTMGALHAGHISLLNKSRELANITVSSIFINPTQFNNEADFIKYPVSKGEDILMLEKNNCDFLFLPAQKEIYPQPVRKDEYYELGYLETILEGKYRPGHFQGVCQVVSRLLNIIAPTFLVVGQKDFQQCMVLKKLLLLINANIKLVICPTLREKDGLAFSSRNLRLTTAQRKLAPEIFASLTNIENLISQKNIKMLKEKAILHLEKKGFKVDYIEIAGATDLNPVNNWDGKMPLVILAAAYLDDVRLIDNILTGA
ncbi:MAG: pantoate--beta-alanine ligase [Ginsengibacter sp.]